MMKMKPYDLIVGNILDSGERFIVHQCNCVTIRGAGLANAIFGRFPWADVYSEREDLEPPLVGQMPGDIEIRGNGEDERFVIALYGQFYGGGYAISPRQIDNRLSRREMFSSGLSKIKAIPDLESIAFPWQIGCGIAGGDWEGWYEPAIEEFAREMKGLDVRTCIYRLPE